MLTNKIVEYEQQLQTFCDSGASINDYQSTWVDFLSILNISFALYNNSPHGNHICWWFWHNLFMKWRDGIWIGQRERERVEEMEVSVGNGYKQFIINIFPHLLRLADTHTLYTYCASFSSSAASWRPNNEAFFALSRDHIESIKNDLLFDTTFSNAHRFQRIYFILSTAFSSRSIPNAHSILIFAQSPGIDTQQLCF